MNLHTEAAVAFMTSTLGGLGGWISRVGRVKAGAVLVAAYSVAVFSAGATSVLWWSEFRTWGERIASLEVRMDTYADSLVVPGIQRIERLEERQDAFRALWEREWDLEGGGRLAIMSEQTHQMYCARWPERCIRIPREP